MRLDTLDRMKSAIGLYKSLGLKDLVRYWLDWSDFPLHTFCTGSEGPRRAWGHGRRALQQGRNQSCRRLIQIPCLGPFHRQRRFRGKGGPIAQVRSAFGSTMGQLFSIIQTDSLTHRFTNSVDIVSTSLTTPCVRHIFRATSGCSYLNSLIPFKNCSDQLSNMVGQDSLRSIRPKFKGGLMKFDLTVMIFRIQKNLLISVQRMTK